MERQTKWDHNLKIAEPVDRVKITYKGNAIPNEVFICRVVHKCAIYVKKPLFCKECKSFGHTKNGVMITRPAGIASTNTRNPQNVISRRETAATATMTISPDTETARKRSYSGKSARIWPSKELTATQQERRSKKENFRHYKTPKRTKTTHQQQQHNNESRNGKISWANIAARNEIQEKVINDLKTETIKLHKYIKSMMDTLQKNDSHGLWKSLKEESTNITSKKNGTT